MSLPGIENYYKHMRDTTPKFLSPGHILKVSENTAELKVTWVHVAFARGV